MTKKRCLLKISSNLSQFQYRAATLESSPAATTKNHTDFPKHLCDTHPSQVGVLTLTETEMQTFSEHAAQRCILLPETTASHTPEAQSMRHSEQICLRNQKTVDVVQGSNYNTSHEPSNPSIVPSSILQNGCDGAKASAELVGPTAQKGIKHKESANKTFKNA